MIFFSPQRGRKSLFIIFMNNDINLFDKNGNRIGVADKLEAHIKGQLHEAFSIFIFDKNNELLIQRRAVHKYHSGGLWTNTCCSHPKVGEKLELAIHRRLVEEMGFDCELKEVFSFLYKAEKLANNLIEHEFDHVFVGYIDKKTEVKPNSDEVAGYEWAELNKLKKDIKTNPQKYTEWFKIIINSDDFNKIK